jgi:hypothetical protein
MGGTTGYLQQKFRELEILNFMTKLRDGINLPTTIDEHLHNTVIHQLQEWKDYNYMPNILYSTIQWSGS